MQNATIDTAGAAPAGGGAVRGPLGALRRMFWPLQRQVALAFCLSILMVTAALQFWNYRTFFATELERTEEKHLVIAENLSLSLSRYINDVARVFLHTQTELAMDAPDGSSFQFMQDFDLDAVAILSAGNTVESFYSVDGALIGLPGEFVLESLRIGANRALGGVQVSDVQSIGGKRYLVLGYRLSGDRLATGYLNLRYLKEVQQRISFGELGHSAIFDHTGRALAHPSPRVEANMMDASGIPIVSRMLNRETGVDQFYSPPMDADMIAGFTFVPETGWAVMVPQPVRELSDAVNRSLLQTYAIAILAALIVGFIGWQIARGMVRPIRHFTTLGSRIAAGDYDVKLPDREGSSAEMSMLNEALKNMVGKVRASDARLREALRLEEEENLRKSEFIAIASHELRTPLNGVMGMLTVCREYSTSDEIANYLTVAQSSAGQLNGIVDEMVLYAEGELDQITVQPAPFDLAREMSGQALIFEEEARKAGLGFTYAGPKPDPGAIETDRNRVMQILSNIVSNAIKYTEDGSVGLVVRVDRDADGGQPWLHLQVTDTGIGIDPREIGRIFEPFHQLDTSFARSHRGLGIGLSVARNIVRSLGGTITCESEKNVGTKFDVHIPIKMQS